MNHAELKAQFVATIHPDILADWELEDHVRLLEAHAPQNRSLVLQQLPAIWPVSHSLCYAFLDKAGSGLSCLDSAQVPDWVNSILHVYETESLQAACRYMEDVEENFVCRLKGEKGIEFEEVKSRLQPYACGLAGRTITLAVAPDISTDTETIFLPAVLDPFKDKHDNFLLYKLIVSYQWAFIANGTYQLPFQDDPDDVDLPESEPVGSAATPVFRGLTHFLGSFANPSLAADLYHLVETARAARLLESHLPGLIRDTRPISEKLACLRPDLLTLTRGSKLVEALKQSLVGPPVLTFLTPEEKETYQQALPLLKRLSPGRREQADSIQITTVLYSLLAPLIRAYVPTSPLIFQGRLKLEPALKALAARREATKKEFVTNLAMLLAQATSAEATKKQEEIERSVANLPSSIDAALLIQGEKSTSDPETRPTPVTSSSPEFIIIDNQKIRLTEPLKAMIEEIKNDLGHLPSRYISSARGMAGSGNIGGPASENGDGQSLGGALVYDEWDHRRSGFRKDWCHLIEKDITPVTGTFVRTTLEKHRGLLIRLKRQFESLRSRDRFVGRQKDGDDIDLDALVESLADFKAGLRGSDRLFRKLQKDQRDISAIFLVDMSASTEGWVATAIKESLVLLCEAMEVLGDRYAIHGFSGMRRLRSEVFCIKTFEESYSETVKGKIAGMMPREYTRMGPPIRHFTKLLSKVDSAIRLLITLSDGKPEDYDDYKGDYAIEDTRHALIEAKNSGIHPFCITIDRHARDYIGHMYGEVNYVFINDVRKLPDRIPEIYRILTT